MSSILTEINQNKVCIAVLLCFCLWTTVSMCD